jgi:hypothetical protein
VPIQEPVENNHIVAKLCQFSQSKGFIRVLVIKKPAIEDVLTYVHDHSLGEDCQVGIVWIKHAAIKWETSTMGVSSFSANDFISNFIKR